MDAAILDFRDQPIATLGPDPKAFEARTDKEKLIVPDISQRLAQHFVHDSDRRPR